MANYSASDYETLRQEPEAARQGQRDAEEQQRRAEEQQRQAEEEREKARELTRETTFDEYIKACHSLLASPRQREKVYNTVRSYLQPANASAPRLFSPVLALQDLGRRLCSQPLSSEKDLEGVERYGKDDHVRDIVSALCRIPAAREMLRLGSGFRFDSHANALDEEATEARERDITSGRMQPDQSTLCGTLIYLRLVSSSATRDGPPAISSAEPTELCEEVEVEPTSGRKGRKALRRTFCTKDGSCMLRAAGRRLVKRHGQRYGMERPAVELFCCGVFHSSGQAQYLRLCNKGPSTRGEGVQGRRHIPIECCAREAFPISYV
ncbi:hypothetical protein KC319_g32 [Hortaea werneckii]|nr:hypothetical protein KC319_g32 [Hortaea werneckii]